jgi:hypothetical protein
MPVYPGAFGPTPFPLIKTYKVRMIQKLLIFVRKKVEF